MDKEYKPFSHSRWNDTQIPEVTGHVEFTEEELEQSRQELLKLIEHEKEVIRNRKKAGE